MRTALFAAIITCCFTILTTFSFAVTYYTYVNGGSSGFWNVAGTWTTDPSGMSLTGSAVPGNGDVVVILNGYTVQLNANVTNTNLSISILNGGVLDLSTYTLPNLSSLAGSGTLRIGSGYFPTAVTNSFSLNPGSGATVEFYNFTGNLPASINYPNLVFSNSTAANHTISIPNSAAYSMLVRGNLATQATGTGSLTVALGTQAFNVAKTNFVSLTVQGNVSIGTNTTLGVGMFNANHTITLHGNLTNNGTIDLSNSAQYTAATDGSATLTFTGATNNVMACNGRTDLYTLTVNKGTSSTYILSVTSTNAANLNFYSNDKLINVENGTLRLGVNVNVPRVYGSGTTNYDLGSTTNSPMLWIDGADFNTNSNAFVVYGKFRITAGTFTCVGKEGTVIREEGQYIIEGGVFTTEKFRPSTTASTHRGSFTMTGGTFNALGTTGSNADYARFSIPYPEQVFIMSGGTINVSNPQASGGANTGGIHIGCKESNYNVTGGTFNAILSGSASFFTISSTAPFWNLTISKTGGTPTTVRLAGIGSVGQTAAKPLKVLNDLTIQGTNSPILNANGLEVTIGGNFVLNSGATYTPSGNTTKFNGTGDQTFTNSGTITSGLYNLTVDKPSGALIIAGTNTSLTVSQTLHLENGVFNDGGKTINALGSVYNAAVHTGTGRIRLAGTSTQVISGDGTGVFGNLVLENNSMPGATTEADIAISGTLTLAGSGNSIFDINQNLLSLTSTSATAVTTTGSSFSNSKMIRTSGFQSDKGVRKTYGNLTAFRFPFGSGTYYTPAIIQLTSAPTTYGTITARPVNARHPLVAAGNTANLMWYWKITSSGFTGLGANAVSFTFNYNEAHVVPANSDVNYAPARYYPTSWTVVGGTGDVDQGTNTISITNVGFIDGEYTCGAPAAFGVVRIFYSKRNGDWSDTNPGTTPWSNVSHTGPDASSAPTAGDYVYIGDGSTHNHTITITANSKAAGSLEIASGSTLDLGVTTGHNFGTLNNTQIGGSGLLRISSSAPTAQFPAGDFGNFIRESGGTVEYYTTGQSFVIPTTSALPTGLPLISYRNLVLTPGAGRTITLPNENVHVYGNVTVNGNASGLVLLNSSSSRTLTVAGNLVVSSGVLRFENGTAQTVEVLGNLTVNSGAQFTMSSTGTVVTNELILHGNMVNNGTFDMVNGTRICNTTFTGNTNATLTGAGATTEFNVLTLNKGTSMTPILDVNLNAFSLAGGASPLVLVNGTFRLSSAQSVTIANGVDFNIPATARLSANGGTFQITGSTGIDLLLAGTLEVLNGTVNVGTSATDNSIEYAATGQPTISVSGGTLNVRSQVRRSASSSQGSLVFVQSGGVANVGISTAPTATRGVFEILNPGSSFTMSGGTLSIAQSTSGTAIADVYLQPAAYSITGGTVQIGTSTSAKTVDVNSAIPLYNFEVTGTNNTARLEANGLALLGSLTIQATDIFNANGYNVAIAGNFTNLNTDSNTGTTTGGYRAGSATQTTTLNGSLNHQIFTGTSGNLTNFANLVINNTFGGGTVNLQTNSNVRVNGTLTMSNGTLAGSTNTITVIGNVSNSAVHTSSGGGSITLAGSSTQIITGNGNGKFGNVTLNNASGATFAANQEITGTLTFVNGSLNIGAFGLNLSSTSLSSIVGYSAARYIITSGNISDVGVTKAFAASVTSGNFVFPVGVSGKYTPANYTITTGASGGTIRLKPVNSKHPNATGSGTAFIRYYWSVTNNGVDITSLTHTYTYVAADENGNPSDYRDARFQGGAWTVGVTAGNPNTTTRVIVFTNTNLTGDYTAGEQTAFLNPQTYTSVATGNWESDAVWDIDPPGIGLGPPAGSFVIISEGHTVTVTTNTRRTATLEVRGRLHLGTTTGHEFGTVSSGGTGAKTIQIQSSTFPSGNFSAFVAAGGGTIEYNGSVTLPTQTTYNNLTFTGAGTKTLPNVDLVLNGTLTIQQGTVTNAVNNRNIELAGSGQNFVNNGTFLMGTGEITVGGNLTNSGASAVFNAGDGDDGLHVLGSLSNLAGATFNVGADSVGVRGSLINEGTFNAGAGMMRVKNNLTNTSGAFNGGTGAIMVGGALTNNAVFTAGTGTLSVAGSFTNTGAAATYTSASGTLIISGNFANASSATFNASTGTVMVSGNWTNTGAFNSGTGTVVFEGAGAQILNGATTFYRLTRSNGGSLQLNSDISVSDQLTLSFGNIATGTNTVELTNTASQPVTGYGTTAFIDGRVSIAYPDAAGTSRVFPVGKGSLYRPVVIQQTAASTNPVVRVEMINTPPTGTYPVEVGVLSEARYYAIDLLSGTMNAPTVELNFNTNGAADENVLFAGNAHIMRATSATGPWTDEGGSGVFTPAAPAGYATSGVTSIASQTFFTLGYQNVILPIELLSFSGYLESGVVHLFWTTLSEKNNDYFTIERSGVELHFDSIGFVAGAGDSKVKLHYRHTDHDPLGGVSYYRLKQTDFDGQVTYSDIITIKTYFEDPVLSVYPNPARIGEPVYARLDYSKEKDVMLSITDMSGRPLFQGMVDLSQTTDLNDFVKSNWSPGTYILRFMLRGALFTQKIVVY